MGELGRYDKRFVVIRVGCIILQAQKSRADSHPDARLICSYALFCTFVMHLAQRTVFIPNLFFLFCGEVLPLGDPCRLPCDA